jgi:hypothetical protein
MGMMTKFTIAFWVMGLAAAVLFTPMRKYLRSKWLWLGAGLALLIYLPNLIWQVQHDFLSLRFLAAIHARDLIWGRADSFLTDQLYVTTNPFTLPLWLAGLAACLFSGSMRRFRPLAVMYLTTFVLFLVSRGRGYYPAPAYVMLLAAGSVWTVDWLGSRAPLARRFGFGLLFAFLGVGAVIGIILEKPVAPPTSSLFRLTSDVNGEVREMIGWQELTAQVAEIYESLSEQDRTRAVILAGNYGEAGALDLYGPAYGLPRVISGADNLWYRGYGEPEPQVVVVVGFDRGYADSIFSSCKYAGMVTNQFGVRNEETTRHNSLYVCSHPRRPWNEIWTHLQEFQ